MRLYLRLDDEIYDKLLDKIGSKSAIKAEDYIVSRLPFLLTHDPKKLNILLDDKQCKLISDTFGVAINNGEDVVNLVARNYRIRAEGVDFALPDEDMNEIRSQFESLGRADFPAFLKQQILCALEFYLHGSVTRDMSE